MIVLPLLTSLALAAPAAAPPLFLSDDTIHITGPTNDVFAVGGDIWLDESVGDNAFLLGEDIHIVAPLHGDLFSAGGTLTIDAPVHGDVYTVGDRVQIGPEGRIAGHLMSGAGSLIINGPVAGNVSAAAGRVELDGPIWGDARFETGSLSIGEHGHVGGDLAYTAPMEWPDAAAAVDGEVTWTEGSPEFEAKEPVGALAAFGSWALWTGWSYLAKLIVGTALLLLGGAATSRVSRVLVEQPSRSLAFGLVGFVFLPLLSLVAMALVVPLPLGLLGMLTWIVLLYISQLAAAQALGDEALRRYRPDAWGKPVVSLAVGLLPLVLLTSLPWVGSLFWFAATVLGGGAIWLRLQEQRSA